MKLKYMNMKCAKYYSVYPTRSSSVKPNTPLYGSKQFQAQDL